MKPPDIVSQDYMRDRQNPQPGDPLYLHLSDLLIGIRQCLPENEPQSVLDYGCGGSPYRFLFPKAKYIRADLPHIEDIDFPIKPDGTIDLPSDSVDLVMSSQVLEHVPDPQVYLAECRRVLKPGGTLLLSTHGLFQDHGCPYDFQRWTADGLRRAIQQAGFQEKLLKKMTTNKRALAFYQDQYSHFLQWNKKSLFGFLYWLFHLAITKRRAAYHSWCDKNFPECRVVDAAINHYFYVGLIIRATK